MTRRMIFAQFPKTKKCQKHDFKIIFDKNQYMENQKYACFDPMSIYKTIESSRNSAYMYKPYKD